MRITGHVYDGSNPNSDIAFTSTNRITTHWSGFSDAGAGIAKYRIGWAATCLTAAQLLGSGGRDAGASASSMAYTIPSQGFYRASVVAVDQGGLVSEAVCSSGFTYSTAKISLTEVFVNNLKCPAPGLTRIGGQSYYVDVDCLRYTVTTLPTGCSPPV